MVIFHTYVSLPEGNITNLPPLVAMIQVGAALVMITYDNTLLNQHSHGQPNRTMMDTRFEKNSRLQLFLWPRKIHPVK